MSKIWEKTNWAIKENRSFILIRKPDEQNISLYVDDKNGKNCVVLHSFDSKLEKIISDASPISFLPHELNGDFSLELNPTPEFQPKSKNEYENLIRKTVEKIKNSEIEKIVMSRIKVIENQRFNLFQTFKNLEKNHPSAFVYLYHDPGKETWLGATPELLLCQTGNRVLTVSLAGTKLPENEWTEKEIVEQQIVTDYISSQFSDLNHVEISKPKTVRAGKFEHLKSYISAEVSDDFNLVNLLEKLHPTPAVCGLPKEEAFDFIVRNENYDREFYAGFIGIENIQSKEYFVNLRCAQIFKEKIYVYVGGGITADSHPENEWLETELKSGTIGNALI